MFMISHDYVHKIRVCAIVRPSVQSFILSLSNVYFPLLLLLPLTGLIYDIAAAT